LGHKSPRRKSQKLFSTFFRLQQYMKVGSPIPMNAPNGASMMALAIEMQLPEDALARNKSALGYLIERAAAGDSAAFEQIMIHSQQRVMAMSWRMLGDRKSVV